MSESTTPSTRSLEVERVVDATPEETWDAIATGKGIRQWFALDARVGSGEGGSIWLSWGPGSEGEAPIRIWAPPHRLGWTESYGDDEAGNPIVVAVDFHVEGRDGQTVVRLVQSGFSASADWDQMYSALEDGWTYFLFNLAWYLARHRGKERRLVWKRVATDLARDAVWERLAAATLVSVAGAPGEAVSLNLDETRSGAFVSMREGYHFAATLPDLDDSVLFVEVEGKHVGFWLSTYGMASDRADQLQAALDIRVDEALA